MLRLLRLCFCWIRLSMVLHPFFHLKWLNGKGLLSTALMTQFLVHRTFMPSHG
uniref:Uncharacterized protein n=1 Tax=Arundo donax TaxID=35708 RepID=A0A0A9F0N0_ARUDO